MRSPFARDYTKILHSLAYRRLKHKTQVFFNIENDHICTRMEHVAHVESVSHGKEEVSDFLTGQRREKDETEWMVVERPEFRIVEDETFERAQEILRGRHDAFNLSHERQSNR